MRSNCTEGARCYPQNVRTGHTQPDVVDCSLKVIHVCVIDLYGNTVTATVPVGKNPGGIALAAG